MYRKRGRKPDDEDPEVKRIKFLERNRAAASRCRAKKKLWVEELEQKSKEINTTNSTLQQEILVLKSEVQQLKSILIAHKDCPLIVHQVPPEGKGQINYHNNDMHSHRHLYGFLGVSQISIEQVTYYCMLNKLLSIL